MDPPKNIRYKGRSMTLIEPDNPLLEGFLYRYCMGSGQKLFDSSDHPNLIEYLRTLAVVEKEGS